MPSLQPDERVFDLPVELLGIYRQERRPAGNTGEVPDVDIGETGREFGDVNAVNPQRFGRLRAEVRLKRERHRLRVTGPQLVDEGRRNHPRVVECRAMRGQARVLDSGHERTRSNFAAASGGRGKTTSCLSLRRVELELAPVEADEERVLIRSAMIDAPGEHVVGHITIDGRRVVVEIPGPLGSG